ncbi:hypothetical protein [Kineococcus arenarius]|uniref:hypothetical protein n=1 Tax=Kineococcus sp. SYSU DK007 TaxID=3383128 RepID=UPI003D7CBB48
MSRPGQAMSWEEYARLPESPRYEDADGHLVVNPSPSFHQQGISVNLLVALRGVLPGTHRAVPVWAWKPAVVLEGGTYRSGATLTPDDPPAELDLGVARLTTSVPELLTP